MRTRSVRLGAVLFAGALLASCSPQHLPDLIDADDSAGAGSEGLVLKMGEGERRVRRPRPGSSTAQSAPFILKVDARNGGSPDLVMGYEDIAPGEAIQPHRHLVADEGAPPLAHRLRAAVGGTGPRPTRSPTDLREMTESWSVLSLLEPHLLGRSTRAMRRRLNPHGDASAHLRTPLPLDARYTTI